MSFCLIGIARFELTTSCSRSKRSTRLSYIPVRWSNNRKKLEEFKGERRKKVKKVEFLFLCWLSRGFCRGGARFSEDHDARTGVVGLHFVHLDAVAPFGTDFAVDDALHVAVAGVSAAVDDPKHFEARNHQVIDAPFYRFCGFVRCHAVQVDFVFGYREFPGAGTTAHLTPARGTRGACGGFRFSSLLHFLVLVFHVVAVNPR